MQNRCDCAQTSATASSLHLCCHFAARPGSRACDCADREPWAPAALPCPCPCRTPPAFRVRPVLVPPCSPPRPRWADYTSFAELQSKTCAETQSSWNFPAVLGLGRGKEGTPQSPRPTRPFPWTCPTACSSSETWLSHCMFQRPSAWPLYAHPSPVLPQPPPPPTRLCIPEPPPSI